MFILRFTIISLLFIALHSLAQSGDDENLISRNPYPIPVQNFAAMSIMGKVHIEGSKGPLTIEKSDTQKLCLQVLQEERLIVSDSLKTRNHVFVSNGMCSHNILTLADAEEAHALEIPYASGINIKDAASLDFLRNFSDGRFYYNAVSMVAPQKNYLGKISEIKTVSDYPYRGLQSCLVLADVQVGHGQQNAVHKDYIFVIDSKGCDTTTINQNINVSFAKFVYLDSAKKIEAAKKNIFPGEDAKTRQRKRDSFVVIYNGDLQSGDVK